MNYTFFIKIYAHLCVKWCRISEFFGLIVQKEVTNIVTS